jgi:hypothetical protein
MVPAFGILPGLSLKLREHLSHGKTREKGFEIFCKIVSNRLGLDTWWKLERDDDGHDVDTGKKKDCSFNDLKGRSGWQSWAIWI